MSLQDCYTERSYYFLRLQAEMVRYATKAGLNGINDRIIDAFCNTYGDLSLNDTEDYKRALDAFRVFTCGISWAMRCPQN